jgi:3-keto-disaccharide hydrolase
MKQFNYGRSMGHLVYCKFKVIVFMMCCLLPCMAETAPDGKLEKETTPVLFSKDFDSPEKTLDKWEKNSWQLFNSWGHKKLVDKLTNQGPYWQIKESALKMKTNSIGITQILAGSREWKDYEVTAKVKIIREKKQRSFAMAQILFRSSPQAKHCYSIGLRRKADNVGVCYLFGGGDTRLDFIPNIKIPEIKVDTWYWIKIRVERNHIQAKYWDSDTSEPVDWLIDYKDKTMGYINKTKGCIGARGYGGAVAFDNIEVKELSY